MSAHSLQAYILAAVCCLIPWLHTAAYPNSYYTSSSRLASGHWIRIKVRHTGMQEISHEQLRQLGFDNPEAVTIYGYGGVLLTPNEFSSSLPDDLPPVPTLHTAGKLIFYGESDVRNDLASTETSINIVRNAYATAGCYFISDSGTQAYDMPVITYNPDHNTVRDYHTSIHVSEEELDCPAKAGTTFFGADITAPTYSHTLTVEDPYATTATLRYAFAANAGSLTTLAFNFPDDAPLSSSYSARAEGIYRSDLKYYTTGAGYHTFRLRRSDDQSYTITPNLRSSANIAYAAIDYLGILYRRHNDFTGKASLRLTVFSPTSSMALSLTGISPTTQAWNVTDPLNIHRHEIHSTESDGTAMISVGAQRSGNAAYIELFDPEQTLLQPEIIGTVQNQDLHALDVPDLLIVTTPALRHHAEQLAKLHRSHQDMTVHVVDCQEAYNEFSSGTPHPMGIRRLAKMFYDRNPDKFRYLLLYGGGSFDNRALLMPTEDYLITYQCESSSEMNDASTAYCSDSYFGMLADSYSHQTIYYQPMSVAVGRIPALNSSDAAVVNAKIRRYLENPPLNQAINRMLLMADAGDGNSHLLQVEDIADTIAVHSPGSTLIKAYNSLYPLSDNNTNAKAARATISSALTSGVKFMTYCGHGNPDYISFENYYQKSHVMTQKCGFLPLVMMSTCDLFSFDRTNTDMGSAFIYSPEGGAIGLVAAGRTVYQDKNQDLATAFAREVSNPAPGAMTGDMFRNARNSAVGYAIANRSRSLAINCMCYNFGGDPALPLYTPQYSIALDSDTPSAAPLTPFPLSGRITDAQGGTVNSFNGTISLAVYGAPRSVNTYPRRGDHAIELTLDEDLIAEITAEVTDGRFSIPIVLPQPERTTATLRMSLYATAGDSSTAACHISDIPLKNTDPSSAINDVTAPVIASMYLNSPDFTDGDCVGDSPVFHATLLPDASGFNTMSTGIGGIRLSLDDASSLTDLTSFFHLATDGSASIGLPLESLPDGRHSLRLSVADNAGNTAIRSISFIVRGETAASLTVEEYPAKTEATVSLTHAFPDTPYGRLVIEDQMGTAVFTTDNPSFPFIWDLCDNDGNRVSDGEYSIYAILKAANRYGSTPRTRIVVIE